MLFGILDEYSNSKKMRTVKWRRVISYGPVDKLMRSTFCLLDLWTFLSTLYRTKKSQKDLFPISKYVKFDVYVSIIGYRNEFD